MAIIISNEQPVSLPINEKATAIARFTLSDPKYEIRGDALFVNEAELHCLIPEFGTYEHETLETAVRKMAFR